MANSHLHPVFQIITEAILKPRTQDELDAYNKELPACQSGGGECPYPGACRAQHFCNCAGGVQPGVDTSLRGRGRPYELDYSTDGRVIDWDHKGYYRPEKVKL